MGPRAFPFRRHWCGLAGHALGPALEPRGRASRRRAGEDTQEAALGWAAGSGGCGLASLVTLTSQVHLHGAFQEEGVHSAAQVLGTRQLLISQ